MKGTNCAQKIKKIKIKKCTSCIKRICKQKRSARIPYMVRQVKNEMEVKSKQNEIYEV